MNRVMLLAGLGLASLSLTFSATGLIHLFQGAGAGILALAVAFEFAKASTTFWLYRNWRWSPLPVILGGALLALSVVSSLGTYGYLSNAYNVGRTAVAVQSVAVATAQRAVSDLEARRDKLDRLVAAGSARQQRLAYLASTEEQAAVAKELAEARAALGRVQQRAVAEDLSGGELVYAARLLGLSQDELAQRLTLTLAVLLDPMAILLLMASGVKGTSATARVPESSPEPQSRTVLTPAPRAKYTGSARLTVTQPESPVPAPVREFAARVRRRRE